MPQMKIFECQKDKNMTRVKNKVINVKVVLDIREFLQTVLSNLTYVILSWLGYRKIYRCRKR
jgi:hypothetical protein